MRAVVQRVNRASVSVDQEALVSIGKGILVLLGVAGDDSSLDVSYMVEKIANLRIFADKEGKLNLSVKEIGGEALVVSQFTLLGDCRRGRRPSYTGAAGAQDAQRLYEAAVEGFKNQGLEVKKGRFGAMMEVQLVNDGPVTILLDSRKQF